MGAVGFLIAVVFIAWLLARDRRRRPELSAALWVPTLMVMCLGSRSPSSWLNAFIGTSGPGNLVDQAFYFLMIAASWIIAAQRKVRWGKLFAANTALMLFYVYFLISPLWSDQPSDSLIRVLKDFGGIVVVLTAILSEKHPVEAVRAVFVRCAVVLIPLSFVFSRYSFRGFGKTYAKNGSPMVIGVCEYKNSLGEMAMVLSLFLIWDYVESRPPGSKGLFSGMRWDYLLLVAMSLYLLNASGSKTSMVVLLTGVALTYGGGILASRPFNRIVFLLSLAFPLLILADRSSGSVVSPVLQAMGRDATFTGRTNIWNAITLETVNPVLGVGFWNFWGGPRGEAIRKAINYDAPNAHNGYLDIFLDGGVIGVVLLFSFLFAAGNRLLREIGVDRYRRVKFAFLIIAIIGGVTESNFGRLSILWFTTVLAVIDFPPLKAQEELSREPGERTLDGDAVEVETFPDTS